MDTELRQLRRVRWGVRFTLAMGISASLAANILHAHHQLIDQIIAGWPPIAVFATIEAIARVPIRRRWLAVIRMAGLGFVAAIAFWVSYWHMASVAATHGENGAKYLLPLSVDGLVVVSSISLVELTGQITAVETAARTRAATPASVAALTSPATIDTAVAATATTPVPGTAGPPHRPAAELPPRIPDGEAVSRTTASAAVPENGRVVQATTEERDPRLADRINGDTRKRERDLLLPGGTRATGRRRHPRHRQAPPPWRLRRGRRGSLPLTGAHPFNRADSDVDRDAARRR